MQDVVNRLEGHELFFSQKTMSDRYNFALGIYLSELPYQNFLLDDVIVKPTEEDKKTLKNAVSQLDDDLVEFFKKMGKPKVFVSWGENV